ncbi:MAG: hypothetical protein ACREKL_05280 [Chthoniobacterales bacterium]
MKIHALLATFLITTSFAHATLNGLNASPLGDRNSADIGFALWDTFSAKTFTCAVPTSGDLSLGLSQSETTPFGPFLTDYFYMSSGATTWTITGNAPSISINTIVLQIKLTPPASGSITSFLTANLNGGSNVTPIVTASGIEIGGAGGLATSGFSVLQYTFSDVNLTSGQSFTINIHNGTTPGGYHSAIDGFAVDVAPVPEPSTCGIAATLLLAAVVWRRRVSLRKAAL